MNYTFRLKTGDDLKLGIEKLFKSKNLDSAYIVTCVGSLNRLCIRMAGAKPDKQDIRTFEGHFEVVSLVGTLSKDGSHIHISVSDSKGSVVGGHLKEGSIVNTTAETVIADSLNENYRRVIDNDTGFAELVIEHK